MSTGLSIPQELLQGYTGIQRYIIEKLESKGVGIDEIINDLINIRDNAVRPTPTGEIITDYATRMNVNKFLLELAGIYKPKGGINMNFNISDLLYAPKSNIPTSAEVIQGGS